MGKRKDRIQVQQTFLFEGKSNRKHFLKHLILERNYTTMAEVGVRDGRTTFFLLDNIPQLKIFAIDNNIKLFYNNNVKNKYQDRLVPIEGDSSSVANQIPAVDLIFIDADHSYKGVCKDIDAYKSKINPKGLFCGHDIDYPGVNKAVKEKIKNFEVGPNFVWLANF
jgi:predicted O-methyltransferase YrrM